MLASRPMTTFWMMIETAWLPSDKRLLGDDETVLVIMSQKKG